ncbi:MAG: hypothetical protein IKM00_03045 [Clostridia bacterium]|nr:hypothetical protein [Clostridia bacterium]
MKKKKKSNDILYLSLQQSFIKLRSLFSSDTPNPNKLDAVLGDLRFARKQLQKHAKRRPRKILTDCIDTIFEMIEEGNREKIYDFADLIHNMPEIGMGKRTFRFFSKEIDAFNHKYEEVCFSELNTIHINVSKETLQKIRKPKEIGTWALVIGGIAAFLLPLIISIIYIGRLNNGQDFSGFSILAALGALTVGVGLASLFFSFVFQYHRRKFSIICLSIGGFALALSFFMIKNPQFYDPTVSTFYFFALIMMVLPAIFYFLFRDGVEMWTKRKKRINKSKFRNLLKGKKNYWWYEALHKEVNLGFLYHLNKAFTVLFVLTFALTLLTGFKKEMSLMLCPLHIFVYMLSAVTTAFYRIQDNLDFHGKPFVIFGRSRNGGIDSVIFDIIMVAMIGFIPAYVVLLMTAGIWGIALPNL